MFDPSAARGAPDQAPAPIGMRELPQPPAPVMPAYPSVTMPRDDESGPGPDDSVVARGDRVEGTFTSRGTVRVVGSLKGRIEAMRVRIEEGARVEADVVVDEAIIAGEFTGNLTCRKRLEARPSGRISGHVETYKLMLHEGASVEGEVHMLPDPARTGPETIRGSAPIRGAVPEPAVAERPVAPERPPVAGTPRGAERSELTAEVRPAPRHETSARAPRPEATSETLRLTPRSTAPAVSAPGRNGAEARV
jgi:cytoskeletal protein CcmA (bactofilin family)